MAWSCIFTGMSVSRSRALPSNILSLSAGKTQKGRSFFFFFWVGLNNSRGFDEWKKIFRPEDNPSSSSPPPPLSLSSTIYKQLLKESIMLRIKMLRQKLKQRFIILSSLLLST